MGWKEEREEELRREGCNGQMWKKYKKIYSSRIYTFCLSFSPLYSFDRVSELVPLGPSTTYYGFGI